MSSVNKVFLVGHLGGDPELKVLSSGESVCRIRVATSKKWKDKASGQKREDTQWHNVNVWGKHGENVNQYCHKGSLVHVEGELRTRMVEKDGDKRYYTEIVASRVSFLSSGTSKANGQAQHRETHAPSEWTTPQPGPTSHAPHAEQIGFYEWQDDELVF